MNTVCSLNKCTGCMACVDICPKNAINIKDSLSAYNAEIDPIKCINCNLCHNVCQNNTNIRFSTPIKWYQGWAEDEKIRANGSSGGIATALMLSFIQNGGYVCSCLFKKGQFTFEVTNNKDEILNFSGSKYIKSNPQGVYKEIKDLLSHGEKLLFIGLPCHVSALKLFVGEKLCKQLFTVDLICHGTPSPQLLNIFLNQYKIAVTDLKNIKFRTKGKFQITDGLKGIDTTGITDSYLISFLNGLNYTENCYSCQYAKFERISDITLGDSWGTTLSDDEVQKGISLILCQTNKGNQLIEQTSLALFDVDIDKAISNNKQLTSPSVKPKSSDNFFHLIRKGKKYNKIIFRLYPIQSLKQLIKKSLILFHLK